MSTLPAPAMLSVIIPAHDEERLIGATLEALRDATAALPGGVEVIVVDDASTDRTAEIARSHGARVLHVSHRHIAATRNAGAAAARGDRLLFLDADTRVDRKVVESAMAAMDRGAVGGGTAVRFAGPLPLHMRMLERASILAFRVAGITPGCFVFCTRPAYEAVGGFDERLFAAEDVAFGRALARHGRVAILREPVLTSARKMRTYSLGEKARFLARFAWDAPRMLRSREAMVFWYGGRRHDALDEPGPDRERSGGNR